MPRIYHRLTLGAAVFLAQFAVAAQPAAQRKLPPPVISEALTIPQKASTCREAG